MCLHLAALWIIEEVMLSKCSRCTGRGIFTFAIVSAFSHTIYSLTEFGLTWIYFFLCQKCKVLSVVSKFELILNFSSYSWLQAVLDKAAEYISITPPKSSLGQMSGDWSSDLHETHQCGFNTSYLPLSFKLYSAQC